jgi:hypothetical protein
VKKGKVKQFLSRERCQWEKGSHKERVKEGKYGRSSLYSCMKMNTLKPVEIVLRMGEGE